MLKKVIIIFAAIGIPIVIWVASTYGHLTEVSYTVAQSSTATTEGDQAPKVIIVTTIIDASKAPSDLQCKDSEGTPFKAEFTGNPPEKPFIDGQEVRFVGHVHGGDPSYFHATQVFAP
ncbi:MAG: hypothetical protein NTX15_00610 [Candidatus Kapabacteria bacterium]|nr:hypothetical protein [Candidatus Kapabacteria bacterium]